MRKSALDLKPALVVASGAWFGDEIGGAFRIASEFARYCAAKGWEVYYLCAHPEKSREYVSTERGVNVWRYPRPRLSGRRHSLFNLRDHLRGSENAVRRIVSGAGSGRAWVLNGHSPLQYLGALRAFSGNPNVRKVLSVHSPLSEEYKADDAEGTIRNLWVYPMGWILRRIERDCYRRSDLIQCDSQFTRSFLATRFKSEVSGRLAVNPGYVDTSLFSPSGRHPSQIRRALPNPAWHTEDFCFFTLRRHTRRMGIGNLIRACALLRENLARGGAGAAFRLIVGGDGPLRAEYEKLAASLSLNDVVYFEGRIADADLPYHYEAADCFVLPTRALECFGLIVLESWAVGTPVIATPVAAIPELVGPFKEDCLARGSAAADIAEAMRRVILEKPFEGRGEEFRSRTLRYDKETVLSGLEKLVRGDS